MVILLALRIDLMKQSVKVVPNNKDTADLSTTSSGTLVPNETVQRCMLIVPDTSSIVSDWLQISGMLRGGILCTQRESKAQT